MAAVRSCHIDLSGNMRTTGETTYSFSSKDQLQCLPTEKVNQIRKTMLQHEELFKEQVQALHELYSVQKSVMQEMKNLIQGSVLSLVSSTNNKVLQCDQLKYPLEAGKSLNEHISPTNQTEESCVLSMNPLVIKEFTGSSSEKSFSSEVKEGKVLPNACNKQRKTFDLERPPEDYMDESDYHAESNNLDILGGSSCLFEEKRNIVEHSVMRFSQAVLQMGDQSQKQDTSCFSTPSEESQVTQIKIQRSLKECTTGIQDAYGHLSAADHSTSNPSVDSHVEKPPWLLQHGASFATERTNLSCKTDFLGSEEQCRDRKVSEQVQGMMESNADSADSIQAPDIDSTVTAPHLKLEKQILQDPKHISSNGCLLSANCIEGIPCSGMNPPARHLDSYSQALISQSVNDCIVEDANGSGNGSNNDLYQCENRDDGLNKVEVRKSELDEVPQLSNDHAGEVKLAVNSAATEKEQEESAIENDNNEVKSEAFLEEANEMIAAQILLSFAPDKAWVDSKWDLRQTQIELESNQLGGENMAHVRQNRRTRRALNHGNGLGMGETVSWTTSIRGRRRSLRRHR